MSWVLSEWKHRTSWGGFLQEHASKNVLTRAGSLQLLFWEADRCYPAVLRHMVASGTLVFHLIFFSHYLSPSKPSLHLVLCSKAEWLLEMLLHARDFTCQVITSEILSTGRLAQGRLSFLLFPVVCAAGLELSLWLFLPFLPDPGWAHRSAEPCSGVIPDSERNSVHRCRRVCMHSQQHHRAGLPSHVPRSAV